MAFSSKVVQEASLPLGTRLSTTIPSRVGGRPLNFPPMVRHKAVALTQGSHLNTTHEQARGSEHIGAQGMHEDMHTHL